MRQKELVDAKIVDVETDSHGNIICVIVATKDGKRFKLCADDESGCMNSAGICYPRVVIAPYHNR